jgi:hypothetical protein
MAREETGVADTTFPTPLNAPASLPHTHDVANPYTT